jgi:hypothetical protein
MPASAPPKVQKKAIRPMLMGDMVRLRGDPEGAAC